MDEVHSLPPAASSVREARQLVLAACKRGGFADVQRDAVLLTSELVTNAVLHGTGQVELRIHGDTESLEIGVSDANPAAPVLGEASEESGRGLQLVAAIATQWGSEPEPGDGKTVWFRLRRRSKRTQRRQDAPTDPAPEARRQS